MDRYIEFDPEAICEICGEQGAYNIMGDLVCPVCLFKNETDHDDEETGHE